MNVQCTVGNNFCFFLLVDFVHIAHHNFLWILGQVMASWASCSKVPGPATCWDDRY